MQNGTKGKPLIVKKARIINCPTYLFGNLAQILQGGRAWHEAEFFSRDCRALERAEEALDNSILTNKLRSQQLDLFLQLLQLHDWSELPAARRLPSKEAAVRRRRARVKRGGTRDCDEERETMHNGIGSATNKD